MKLGDIITKKEFLRLAPLGQKYTTMDQHTATVEPTPKSLKNGQKNTENSHQT